MRDEFPLTSLPQKPHNLNLTTSTLYAYIKIKHTLALEGG